jgi:polyisoprenoid-binding protein YceI
MMIPKFVLAWLCLLLAADTARAELRRYDIDPVHTRIAFRVDHAGFSQAIGTFSGITGELMLDPEDWSRSQVDAVIPIASLDLGDDEWRERILDPTFFRVKKYPQARFVSRTVEAVGENRLRVGGELRLHGITRPLVLEVTVNRLGRHPLNLRTTAGFSATARLSRADFGMDKWKKLVGDPVEIRIEVEAQRERGSTEEKE